MHSSKVLIIALMIAGLWSGCRASRGPGTHAYLQAYARVSADLGDHIRHLSPLAAPKPPSLPPHPTKQERVIYTMEVRNFPNTWIGYCAALGERCRVLSDLYGRAQNEYGRIPSAGVDREAVNLVTLREHAIGQRRELYVEIARMAELKRDTLVRRGGNDEIFSLFTDIATHAMEAAEASGPGMTLGALIGAADGLTKIASKRETEDHDLADQSAAVKATATQLQRDVVKYQTALAELKTRVQAEYPDEDWSFLTGSSAASTSR